MCLPLNELNVFNNKYLRFIYRSVISSPGSQSSRSRIHSDGSTKKPSILSRENLWPFSLGKSQSSIAEEKKENKKVLKKYF